MASLGRFKTPFILMLVLLYIVNVVYAQSRNPTQSTVTPGDFTTVVIAPSSTTPQPPASTAQNTQSDKSQDSSTQATQQPTAQDPGTTDTNIPTDSGNPGPTGGNTQPAKTSKPVVIVTTTNQAGGAITITSTSTSFSLQVPTTSLPNRTQTPAADSGGDTSTNVVTAAIAVGAVVIAAIIGIWIFRKWKLTPSRNFKEKIQPVSFAPRSAESDTVFLRELNEP